MIDGRRIALLSASAVAVAACANVFGLDEYADAPAQLCKSCEKIPDCEARLDAELAGADDDEVAAWLSLYDRLGCGDALCDDRTLECFYRAPGTCAEIGGACIHSQGCCKFDFDDPAKGERCCVGDSADGGVCCDACTTCFEKLVSFIEKGDGVATLCSAHKADWDAVLQCRNAKCLVECTAPFDGCQACMAKDCKPQVDACTKNAAP